MKVTARLVIQHDKQGQPLPMLELQVGDDSYIMFAGEPVADWRPGCTTQRETTVDVQVPR